MNVYRGLYYATLMGTVGGLLAALAALITMVPVADSGLRWLPDALYLVYFGILVAIVLFLHFDRVLLRKLRFSSVGWGLLCGGVAGGLAALLAQALRSGIGTTSPVLYRLSVWALCFSVIGLGIGLRWVLSNRVRVLHAYIGSLAGGLLGGAAFVLFSPHMGGLSTVGLMLAGAGTGFGAGIAPILVREGIMRFVSSGDARAHNKLGSQHATWNLDVDESYVLGSNQTAQNGTRFQQGADIWIPDSAVAPRHAIVFSKEGRFFIVRHPDVAGPEGIAKYVLRIKGKTVVSSQELHAADDVLIGRTALRFEGRKQGE